MNDQELVRRMKTAIPSLRSAILLSLVAGLALSSGLVPLPSSAQESRTLATGSNIPLAPNAPGYETANTPDDIGFWMNAAATIHGTDGYAQVMAGSGWRALTRS